MSATSSIQDEQPPQARDTTLSKRAFEGFRREVELERLRRHRKDPESVPQDGTDAWPKLAKRLQDFDMTKIGGYKDDIDTLLVFAGLFSAVLATFSVESYKLLQPDNSQTSVFLLAQISQQLNSFSVNPSFVNASYQAAPTDFFVFRPPRTVVVINALWFLSLVFSLATASLAMMVKQWLRAYLSNESTSPQAQARVRYMRSQALVRWNVFEIASLLPSLLQFALALFFVALSIFLHQFHHTLWITVTGAITLWFAFYAFVLGGPIFASSCPYKSPSLNAAVVFLRQTLHHLFSVVLQSPFISIFTPRKLVPSPLVEEKEVRIIAKHDGDIWTEAETVFFDDEFVKDTVHVCLAEVEGPAVLRCVRGVIERRSSRREPDNLSHHGQDSVSLALVNTIVRGIGLSVGNQEGIQWDHWMAEAYCLLADGWKHCSKNGVDYIGDLMYCILQRDWDISGRLLRYRYRVSLEAFVMAFMRKLQSKIRDPDEDRHMIENVLRAATDLLAFGEIFPGCEDITKAPVDPSTLDLAVITNALLVCYRILPESEPPSHLQRELENTINLVISVSLRWVSRGDYNSPFDYSDGPNAGWKVASTTYSGLISGRYGPVPDAWRGAFKELHDTMVTKALARLP